MGIESVDDWVVLLLCLNQKDSLEEEIERLKHERERERERMNQIFFFFFYNLATVIHNLATVGSL